MKQVQVRKGGERVYTEAPVRRETPEEAVTRQKVYIADFVYINEHLKPGKPNFIGVPCMRGE